MTTTQNVTSAAAAAPAKAPEAAANKAAPVKKAEWIKSFDLNLNTARSVFNYETESCLVSIAAKVASLFIGVLEALQNVTKAIANVAIWTANGVHSLFEEEAPVAPVKPTPAKPAPVATGAAAATATPVASNRDEDVIIPEPIPRMTIVKDFAKSHKAALITAPVAGTAAGVSASYLLGLGLLGSSLTGVGSAIVIGYAANRIANHKAVVAPAAPAAAVARAIRV